MTPRSAAQALPTRARHRRRPTATGLVALGVLAACSAPLRHVLPRVENPT